MTRIPMTATHPDLMPTQGTPGSAGWDLRTAYVFTVQPGDRLLVPTGVRMAIPPGFEGQIRPRSGLALRHGLTVLNAPGTIDSDYRGEVGVLLINHGEDPVTIGKGERIAQIVFMRVAQVEPLMVTSLNDTTRGAGGFGSTGVE